MKKAVECLSGLCNLIKVEYERRLHKASSIREKLNYMRIQEESFTTVI